MTIAHVELELAREPANPFGDRDHVYHLYLPILSDGRVDETRAGCGRCRFRCRRPGACEARGPIRLGRSGEICLDYGEGDRVGKIGFPSEARRFEPGEVLPITDEEGEVHPFQIVSIRQEWAI